MSACVWGVRVCVRERARHLMLSKSHTVRNTNEFMGDFAHTYTHIHTLLSLTVEKRVSSGSCQLLPNREQWASQKQPPRLSLCTHMHTYARWHTHTQQKVLRCGEKERMRCLGQMQDQLSKLHEECVCGRLPDCLPVRPASQKATCQRARVEMLTSVQL